MWLPIADADRRAADSRVRCHAPLNRRGVDERLEARASLTIGLSGVVEFVRVEIVTTDHSDDLTGLSVERHHRALHSGHLRQFNFQATILLVDFLDLKLRRGNRA